MNVSAILGAAPLIAIAGEIIVFVVLFSTVAMFFIVAIGNRTDQDPTGSRPIAAYLFSGAFLFLWIAYFGILFAAVSLINLIGSHPNPLAGFGVPGPSYGDAAIRACVLGAILVAVAGGAYALHLRKGNVLADAELDASGPTKRVMRSYVALVSFVSIVIVVIALSVAIWMACGLISPRIFLASSSRTVTARGILDALVLVVLAGGIFGYHQRFAPEGLRLLSAGRSARRGWPDDSDHAGGAAPSVTPTS